MNRLRGLYVHIPFCSVKCFYCDFTAFAGQRASVRRYLAALEQEAQLRHLASPHRHPRESGGPYKWIPAFAGMTRLDNFSTGVTSNVVDTLYIGGGTPSELSADELRELFRIIESAYRPVRDFIESTVEANPESLAPDKLDILAGAGVSRLSLGLQTMEPRLLKEIGRRHTVDQFLETYRLARRMGFDLNVDLMTGLPTQTLGDATTSLDVVLALEPEHISLYGLSVEDRTLFAKRGIEVDEDLNRQMYEHSIDQLTVAGYHHYEISNFAKPGHESAHNQIYWADGEYIGLGCGASGHVAGIRYANKDRLNGYCEAVERGEIPETESENLTGKAKLGESLLLGLRRIDGVKLTPAMESIFAHELDAVERQGWVQRRGLRAQLTREGLFMANRVFQEFVEPFRESEVVHS